jgi:hypothetical protein
MTDQLPLNMQAFDSIDDLAEILEQFAVDVRAYERSHTDIGMQYCDPTSVVNVMDRDGNTLRKAVLEVETLTDGSRVYNVTLK